MRPSNQPISEQEIQAYVDDELDNLRREEVEQQIQQNPELAKQVSEYQGYNDALHQLFDPVLQEEIPDRLTDRIQRKKRAWPLAQAASILIAVTVGISVGWISRGELMPARVVQVSQTETLVKDAFSYHAVYTPEVIHPVEVTADEQQHLTKWLSKRLKTPVKAPSLSTLGFELLGGRLLSSEAKPAAQFMYQNEQGKRLTLFTRKSDSAESETAFQYAAQGNANAFYWIDSELSFVLIGDIPREHVSRAAHHVYEDLER